MATTEAPPFGENTVPLALVRTGTTFIILYSTCATLLFVLTCAILLRHSHAHDRRRKLPTLLVLSLAMVLGLLGSVLNTVFWATLLIKPSQDPTTTSGYWLATTSMLFIVPLVAQTALVIRLWSFYPRQLAKPSKRYLVCAFPILMKLARIPAIVLYLRIGYDRVSRLGPDGFDGGLSTRWANKWPTVCFALTLADSTYVCIFLIRKYHHLGSRSAMSKHNELLTRRSIWLVDVVTQGFYAIGFCFVVPTLFTLGVLVSVASPNVSPTKAGYLLVANVFCQIFGATIACTSASAHWRDDRYVGEKPNRRSSPSSARRMSFGDVERGLGRRRYTVSSRATLEHDMCSRGRHREKTMDDGHPLSAMDDSSARSRAKPYSSSSSSDEYAAPDGLAKASEGDQLALALAGYLGPGSKARAAPKRSAGAVVARPTTSDSETTVFDQSRRGSAARRGAPGPLTLPPPSSFTRASMMQTNGTPSPKSLLESRRPSDTTLFGSPVTTKSDGTTKSTFTPVHEGAPSIIEEQPIVDEPRTETQHQNVEEESRPPASLP